MYADDPNDPRRDRNLGQVPGGAPAAPAAGGGGAPAGGAAPAAPAAHGTGFINLSQYLGANQAGAQGMANTLGSTVAQQGQQALADAGKYGGELARSSAATADAVDPALQAKLGQEATKASMSAQALQSPGGIGALLTNQYGQGGGYSSGMRGFDSFLAGAAGGNQFQQLGNQYGGLDKYVSGMGAGYMPNVGGGPGKSGPPAHAPISMEATRNMGPGQGGGTAAEGERRKRRMG